MNIGTEVRAFLRETGIKPYALSIAAGLNKSTVRNLLLGTTPNGETVIALRLAMHLHRITFAEKMARAEKQAGKAGTP